MKYKVGLLSRGVMTVSEFNEVWVIGQCFKPSSAVGSGSKEPVEELGGAKSPRNWSIFCFHASLI